MLLKTTAIWASFIPIAIANGFFREKSLVPLFGQHLALPISGATAAILFFLLTYFTLPWLGQLKVNHYRVTGLEWFVLTITFEFLFGRFVAGKSWKELLQAYDITTGNLWLLVLLVIALSPYLVARLRGFID